MFMPRIMRENLFDDFFNDFARPVRPNAPAPSMMKADVKETESGFELAIDLPGFKKEDIQAQLKDGCLTISASTKKESDEKDDDGKFVRRERFYGSCSRSFYVGEDLKQDDITAKFENGVLSLFVPKKAPEEKIEETKYIAIEG